MGSIYVIPNPPTLVIYEAGILDAEGYYLYVGNDVTGIALS